jgi:N-acetyl-gamma-glutamyl-phosphate reductase
MKAGIVGASGYTGAELLRLLVGHPELEVVIAQAGSSAGAPVGSLYPGLGSEYCDLAFGELDPAATDGLDVVFVALPSGESQHVVPLVAPHVGHVVDLGADFRLRDPALYPQWYGFEHVAPELLAAFVYGLPELGREALHGARLIAAPGCYVTAAALAITPLVRAGVIEPSGVIVDAASGLSGAGRQPGASTHYAAVNEGFTAYGLLSHRHTPEIEQVSGATVIFTPHLAPMTRGILATCYARPAGDSEHSTDALLELLRGFYRGEPFVRVVVDPPSTRHTLGSNSCHITVRYDDRSGYVLVLAALDNLVKGASGQALQSANLALGLPETLGLPSVGIGP